MYINCAVDNFAAEKARLNIAGHAIIISAVKRLLCNNVRCE